MSRDAQPWIGRAPLAVVVVVLGIALSIFAWRGLRSVESTEADIAYERLLPWQDRRTRRRSGASRTR
jgi:hypothetical protein